jgi:DNA-binding response OmpR family regulator
MVKTVLVIDDSELIRGYLETKLVALNYEVLTARNGFDGLLKLKNNVPDLVVMDDTLARKSALELLSEKSNEKAIAGVPVILLSQRLSRDQLVEMAKYKLAKVLTKPIRVDALIREISDLTGDDIRFDATPCVLDVHLNDQILFVEVSQGLNRDKIELLTYKVGEVLELYGVSRPRVLIMITDIQLGEDTSALLRLLEQVLEATASPLKRVQILTASAEIAAFVAKQEKFVGMGVSDNISEAMDHLLGVKIDSFVEEGKELLQQDLLSAKQTQPEQVQLRFSSDTPAAQSAPAAAPATPAPLNVPRGISVAIVDDDEVIRTFITSVFQKSDWQVHAYENGKLFLENLKADEPALLFLDLQMPVLNGFQVLQYMREHQIEIPVIILSALTQKETIVKAQAYGVNSYMIKPVSPDMVRRKSIEALSVSL